MRKFSRWLPPAPEPFSTRLASWLLLGLLGLGLLCLLWRYPVGTLSFLLMILDMSFADTVSTRRVHRREAAARSDEDIGTFARALDRRAPEFDPWIVRAVWDALQPYVYYGEEHLPLRPSDDLVEDLRIDPDELEYLAVEVAGRVGRSTTNWLENPKSRVVRTVADLIGLIAHQPRQRAA